MRRAPGFLSVLLLMPLPALADGIAIDHDGIGCVVAGKFPQFFARFDPSDDVARAQLVFKPTGGLLWYSVPMRPSGPSFVGIIPKPEKSLKKFDYYITAIDKTFNEARTAEYSPDVMSGPGACGKDRMMPAALLKAKSVIVNPPQGLANAAKVPAGFSPDGVIVGAGAAGAATAGAVAGAGLGKAALVLGGVAVAGGTAAVLATRSGGSDAPSSLTGQWDGFLVATYPASNCTQRVDTAYEIVQSGTTLNADRRTTPRSTTCAGDSVGAPQEKNPCGSEDGGASVATPPSETCGRSPAPVPGRGRR